MRRICICCAALVGVLTAPVALAGVATASDGSFEFRGSVDLAGAGGGETLCELPGLLRLVVRQAGKDPALAKYDRELGNYLNFPLADGSVPVLEAEFPNARHSIAPWYLKELPPGCRIGVPLAVLPAKKGPRAFRVVCAKTRVRLYVDGALYDEESLVAPLAPAAGSEPRSRSPRLASAELVAPAPADAFGREPDARPIEGPIQYWTSDGYNTWVGDVVCCRFRGRLHVFYLKDRRHHRGKGGSGGHCFAHISSADLVRWTAHPDAVPVEDWWMTVGTGTPFELDGRLCLSYGIHSTRFVPQERTTEPAMFAEYERTGVMPQVRFAGTDLVPLGATWAESEDGVHFRPSGVLFHTTQNPGIQNLPDGRLKLVTGFLLDVGAKGVFVSRGMDGWKAVDDPNPLSGDCPCPFEWNGHRYLLQGFSGYARAKGDAPLAKAPGSDIYDGLGVPMVAPWGENRRLLIGWLRHHYGWGGWLVFRELVQRADGSLGTKWVDEIRPPSPVVTARAKGGERLVRDFARADGRETIRLTVDPKAGAAFLSTVAADGKERRRPILTLLGDSPVTGVRGLERDYAVRYVLHYDRKADTTVFDVEIAGNRTLIDEWPGRFCACGATAANMTEASRGTTRAAGSRERGLLLLRFDDRYFASWEKALPIFEKTGAHATFFINGAIDGRAVATMRKLKAAGHSLAAHGLGHLKVVDSVARMGAREYLEKELRPQLVAAEKAGVPLRHFGYPCSQRDAQSDALLLTRFDRIAGGGFWQEAKEGRIVSCDEMFVPVAEASRRRVWIGTCIGNFAPTVTGELARVVRRLSERNEATLLYAHNIVSAERPDHHDMSFAALEFLLKAAKAAGVRVCGFDELAFDGFALSRERLFPGFDGKFCKMQPTVATDWKGTALLTFQRLLLTGSDVFYGQFIAKSSDGGRTWGEPKEIGIFKDTHEDGCRVARYANVRYARKAGRWYALGHAQLYADDTKPLDGRVNGRPTGSGIFATVDPVKGELTSYTDLPFPFAYDSMIPFGDPVELDNGELIVPFYYCPEGARTKKGAYSPPGKIVCVQYRFGAKGLEVVRAGRPVECPELKRGCGEPSLAQFNGRFYLTVRSDERGMYAESADGLVFGELRTWCWEDGTPIGNRNTQQHWMQLSSGLYLAYTREGALNDHVFRNRAPIFLARFDPQRRCLVRSTELPLVPEYGARLGNFQTISDGAGAAWLVTAEWMQPIGCEKYGSDNALWLVKMETR